jgi:cytochrome c-type biogenesis protein CcmE
MSGSMKAKHQRLILVLIALVALVGAGMLAAWALRSQASFFYLPTEYAANPPEAGRAVRLGGMVEKGSILTQPDGVTITFVIHDDKARVPVTFKGIVPDLFVEGSGAVAEGRRQPNGSFRADNVLAKHDENYVPREMKNMTSEQARQAIAETQ